MLGRKEWSQTSQNGVTDTSLLQHNSIEINATLDRFFEAINKGLLSSLTSTVTQSRLYGNEAQAPAGN